MPWRGIWRSRNGDGYLLIGVAGKRDGRFVNYRDLPHLDGEGNGIHSSALARKIPWTEEPGRLQSMGSRRVGHLLSDFTFMHWRRKRQPTPVFLPGESQGRRSLVGCHLWGRTESDTTDMTSSSSSSSSSSRVVRIK